MNDALLARARLGDSTAMYELAMAYDEEAENKGNDVDIYAESLIWMEKAAELDHVSAQVHMFEYYELGGDFEKHFYWLERAAQNGNEKAIQELKRHQSGSVQSSSSGGKGCLESIKRGVGCILFWAMVLFVAALVVTTCSCVLWHPDLGLM
ncbi:MAG: hypothetical protein FWC89_04090 [Defluviitaleaceae bacterium]|nr:hypothetical protein [Defluviitaleaceae bacterium]